MFIIPMILFFLAGCEEKNTITDFGCGSEITVKPGYPIDKGDIEEISPLLPRTVPASAVTVTGTQINLTSTLVRNEVKVVLSSDSHLVDFDEREEPYRQYSNRMYEAYSNPDYKIVTKDTDLKQYFRNFVTMAAEVNASAMFSLGDLVSYPSEFAIEWINQTVSEIHIPFYPINGNHDWHYELYPGTPDQIREKWTEERLIALYPSGVNPMCYSVEIGGIRFVLMDDSTDEIKFNQLEFIRREIETGKPIILLMHVPMYSEGRAEGWALGNPEWRYDTASSKTYFDKSYFEGEYARSNPMHTNITNCFYNEVLSADNVIACIAGHVHSFNIDEINGMLMLTLDANYKNNAYCLTISPAKK